MPVLNKTLRSWEARSPEKTFEKQLFHEILHVKGGLMPKGHRGVPPEQDTSQACDKACYGFASSVSPQDFAKIDPKALPIDLCQGPHCHLRFSRSKYRSAVVSATGAILSSYPCNSGVTSLAHAHLLGRFFAHSCHDVFMNVLKAASQLPFPAYRLLRLGGQPPEVAGKYEYLVHRCEDMSFHLRYTRFHVAYTFASPRHRPENARILLANLFHATGLRLLLWIPHVPEPSMTAYARHNFRHFGVRQQYPPVK